LLNAGENIICGRYSHSGVAYSNAKGMDLEVRKVKFHTLTSGAFNQTRDSFHQI
jgi:thymidylate kinase